MRRFYTDWNGTTDHRVTGRECQQADNLLRRYSADGVILLLQNVIHVMKHQFPEVRAFGATLTFWPEMHRRLQQERDHREREVISYHSAESEDQQRQQQAARKAALRQQWDTLDDEHQHSIRVAVAKTANAFVQQRIAANRYDEPLVKLAGLDELKRCNKQSNPHRGA